MSREEERARVVPFLTGVVFGAAIGASVALLWAPTTGKQTRKRIQRAAGELKDTATERWEGVADDVRHRVEDVLDGARTRLR